MRMIGQKFSERFSQRARSVAVNYAHFGEAVQESRIEKLVSEIDRFVGCFADLVQFVFLEFGLC